MEDSNTGIGKVTVSKITLIFVHLNSVAVLYVYDSCSVISWVHFLWTLCIVKIKYMHDYHIKLVLGGKLD
jgi:hypothetical protein